MKTNMNSLGFMALALLALMLAACHIVSPSEAALADTTASNARAKNAAIQKIVTPTQTQWEDLKVWLNSDATQWGYFSDLLSNRKPVAATQP